MTVTEVAVALPEEPYRGIDAFRFQDHAIFFSREHETQRLVSLISVYRGVLLYGDTGCGKSSLINAGLLPEAIRVGFAPERVRVEPRDGGELVIRRIRSAERLIPSVVKPSENARRIVLSINQFEEGLIAACRDQRPVLIFDQFEEIVTRFVESDAQEVQNRVLALIVRLLRGRLPVKLLLSFREDYLGKVRELLSSCPELVDQTLRVAPPSAESLPTMIRGPFERYPGHFSHELSPSLGEQLASLLQKRFGAGTVSLSEMQTVCLRLWQSEDPQTLLEKRGAQGLLEDYLGEALDKMPARLRRVAIVLLSQMVTSVGTRNVIAKPDLFQRVREQTPRGRIRGRSRITDEFLQDALARLSKSRLVRSEHHRDIEFYEITSEFLIPWISDQRQRLREAGERRRQYTYGALAAVLGLVAIGVTVLALWALHQRSDAQKSAQTANSLALASDSQASLSNRLDASLLLAMAALAPYRAGPSSPPDARSSMIDALQTARLDGVIGVLHGHTGPVNSVAFSPDGSLLASGNDDDSVRLWNVATQRQQGRALGMGDGHVESVAFDPGRATVAAGDENGRVRVWDVGVHPHLEATFQGSDGPVTDLAIASQSHSLAVAYNTGKVFLWNLSTARPDGPPISSHDGAVNGVAFSPDGRLVAVGSGDGAVTVLSPSSHQRRVRLLATNAGAANSVSFSPDGEMLAAAYQDGSVRVWSLKTHQLRFPVLIGSAGAANSVAFSPTGSLLTAAGDDGVLRVWHVAGRAVLSAELGGPSGPIYSVAFSPNGQMIASARGDGTVRLTRTVPTPLSTVLIGSGDGVISPSSGETPLLERIAVSRDGTILAAAQSPRSVQLWDLESDRRLGAPLVGPDAELTAIALGDGKRDLAAAYSNDLVRLWNTATHRAVGEFAAASGAANVSPVTSVAISRDGRLLALGKMNGNVWVWRTADHRLLRVVNTHAGIYDLAFDPGGRTLASADADGTVHLWDISNGKDLRVLTGHTGAVYGVAFNPAGTTLASANQDGTIRLWSVAKGDQLGSLSGHTGSVLSVAYSSDGGVLVSAGSDRTVRLWDVASQRQVGQTLESADAAVDAVAFGDGGQTLVSSDSTGVVRVYSGFLWTTYTQLEKQVCRLVPTGLSHSEWHRYAPGVNFERICS
jgi:WD40 repeat protein